MRVCSNCGQENPERARFCLNCGAALARTEPAGEERKVVTVLFCDLVGLTERTDRADPEDVKATLRPYHARLKQEIEHFGGTLDKFVGAGVMGVFGAPAAHEDDPERAVRAAIRILEAMEELSAAHPALRLAAQIGIATGTAVVTFATGPQIGENVTGDVVNTASRVQSIAPAGGVAVAGSTHEATKDLFDYREVGPVTVKGKAEPLQIWQPLASRGRLGVAVDQHQRPVTPFVGREEELSLLKAAFRRSLRESSVQLVTVTGEPGIGKSRLVAELRFYIDELPDVLVRWRQGRCLPYGEGVTFWALGEIVKAQASILETDDPAEARTKLERAVEAGIHDPQERVWVARGLGLLVGLSADDESDGTDVPVPAPPPEGEAEPGNREQAFTAWRRFLECLAEEHPLVLVFEDLHWADGALLDFLDHLMEWSMSYPILLLCAARPELYDRHPRWGGGRRNTTTVPLMPLADRDMAILLAATLDQAVLPAETREALLARSGGNPMYAEEFVRMLTDRGVLERRGAVLHLTPGAAIPVPESVQALVAARLDTLPKRRKQLLHDAAVIGNVFWPGALQAMSGLDATTVSDELIELSRKELVRPSRTSSVEGEEEWSFWHLLVRDVAYGQIPRVERGREHRAAARWIEGVAGERAADRAEVLAYHYDEALQLARSSGELAEADELREPTLRYLVMAGDRDMQLDVGRARTYYLRALDIVPAQGDPRRPGLLARSAWAARSRGDLTHAEQEYREALAGFEDVGDTAETADVLVRLSNVLWHRGDVAGGRELLARAIELLEGAGESAAGAPLVNAYTERTRDEWLSGHASDALVWGEKALALADRMGQPDQGVRPLGYRGVSRAELGDPGGLDDLRQALAMALELGMGRETVVLYDNLASQVEQAEGAASGLELYRVGIEFADRRGLADLATFGRSSMLRPLFSLGRWDEALRVADEVIHWAGPHGSGYADVVAGIEKARILAWRGRLDEAADLVAGFLPRAREIDEPHVRGSALVVAALVERFRSAPGEPGASAIPALLEEYDRATAGRSGWDRAQVVQEAVRLAVAAGHLPLAHRVLDDVEPKAWRQRCCVVSARAALLESEGSTAEAASEYARAGSEWHGYGFVLEEGLGRLGEARTVAGLGRQDEAAALAAEAGELFEKLEASAAVAQARAFPEAASTPLP